MNAETGQMLNWDAIKGLPGAQQKKYVPVTGAQAKRMDELVTKSERDQLRTEILFGRKS